MTCSGRELSIQAYVDGELDLDSTLAIEEHLSACSQCATLLVQARDTRAALRRPELTHALPPGLESRIRQAVRSIDTAPSAAKRPAFPLYRMSAALALACLATVAVFLIPSQMQNRAGASIEREAVDSHIRSLAASHLYDVASTDQHTVKPWFDGKLDFSPPVADYTAQGFPLEGGRLDYFDSHPVAALVYRHRKHIINIFIWPTTGPATNQPPFTEPAVQGYNIVQWRQSGMTCIAVSDVNARDLMQLAGLIDGG